MDNAIGVSITFVEPCNRFEGWKANHAPRWFRRLWPVRHQITLELSSIDITYSFDGFNFSLEGTVANKIQSFTSELGISTL